MRSQACACEPELQQLQPKNMIRKTKKFSHVGKKKRESSRLIGLRKKSSLTSVMSKNTALMWLGWRDATLRASSMRLLATVIDVSPNLQR